MDSIEIRQDDELAETLGDRIVEYATTGSDELRDVLIEIFKRLPDEAVNVLLDERDVYFVCPQACCAVPFGGPARIMEHPKIGQYARFSRWLVLLRSDLLDEPMEEVIYTIVHELAHVFKEQHGGATPEEELEADEQVIAWGFEKELKATPETYLYGTALKNNFPRNP